MHGDPYIFNNSMLPTLPTPPKKSWKCIEIIAFPVILGFPRFLLHRRNHGTCIEIHPFFMVLGCPRLPLHRRNHEKCVESMHCHWFWIFHASHSIEKIMKNALKSCIFNDSELHTFPTSQKKSWEEIFEFSMILGFSRFPLHRFVLENAKKNTYFLWF